MTAGAVGDFYQVIKTIKGRKYLYKQRTFRQGGRVRTESHYLGPAGAGDVARVKAEQTVRQGTPSLREVATAVRVLSDPTKAATSSFKDWGDKGTVNTTFARNDPIDRHVATLGAVVIEHPNAEGAYYSLGNDVVVLPAGSRFIDRDKCSSTEGFYLTLMHELAHWTGSEKRLNRKTIGFGQVRNAHDVDVYAREELVAETTAMLVLEKLGMPVRDKSQSARYFQGYLGATWNKGEALEYVVNEAHRAAAYILASPQLTAIKASHGLL